jgi:hypothetical protein
MSVKAVRPGGFSGQFRLDNVVGTFWNDYTQTGALELSARNDGEIGCGDRVKITANGSAITFSSNYTWTNVGTDSISAVAAAVNTILVWKVSPTELNYVVKVT